MILNDQTWANIKDRLRFLWIVRPYLARVNSIVRDDAFHASFIHGASIWTGVFVGLLLWSVFQKTPTYPAYTLDVPFPAPVAVEALASPAVSAPAQESEKPLDGPVTTAPGKVALPLAGLTEHDQQHGDLPIIRASDSLRPFDAYRHPFPADELNKPLVAIVMMDYGLSAQTSKSILGVLPSGVNLLISPAALKARDWVQEAYDHGHEVWLQLALEPPDYPASDPGDHALLTAASIEKNQDSLRAQLGHAVGYVGVFSPSPSPYFASGADADFIANAAFDRGLGLMINAEKPSAIVRNTAIQAKAPFYMASMTVVDDPSAYAEIFKKIERQARDKGFAIVLFSPLPAAQKAILDWAGDLKANGYALAPLSVIAERGRELSP